MEVSRRNELVTRLWNMGAICCEGVSLKTGQVSPIYFNLRLLISDPQFLAEMAAEMWEKGTREFDQIPNLVCGVPYAALPLATCISLNKNLPMIMCRKDRKDYGTKQLIEGKYQRGDESIIIEDVTAYGSSVAEIAQLLRSEGLAVSKGIVILDREQGALPYLRDIHGVDVKCLLTLEDVLEALVSTNKISDSKAEEMRSFVKQHRHPDQVV
ncbi:hypothetical protein Ciccas_012710 [Cichlidogyrus casuarinus]|uniref:orotate phosphoribosyltransferase n=1 Tax=Cichlidogyrus casuarinus TaxID=1844966 RepID=A0ABD2PMK0_9PLAT